MRGFIRHDFEDGSRVELLDLDSKKTDPDVGGWRREVGYRLAAADGHTIDSDFINSGVHDDDFDVQRAFETWLAFATNDAETYEGGTFQRRDGTDSEGEPLTERHEWAYQHESELAVLFDDAAEAALIGTPFLLPEGEWDE